MFNFNEVNEQLSQEKISKIKDIIRWLLDSYYRATGIKVIL
jgi:two-component system response regulator YesN